MRSCEKCTSFSSFSVEEKRTFWKEAGVDLLPPPAAALFVHGGFTQSN